MRMSSVSRRVRQPAIVTLVEYDLVENRFHPQLLFGSILVRFLGMNDYQLAVSSKFTVATMAEGEPCHSPPNLPWRILS